MKRIFRKNQIIITALALMIAVAGYISYTQTTGDDAEAVVNEEANAANEIYDISDEDIIENVFTDTEDNSEEMAQADTDDAETADAQTNTDTSEENGQEENPGETVLTNADGQNVDFAAEMKLSREQTRSKNKEALLEIVNNSAITEAQKKDAINKMIEMTSIAEKENAAEILLEAKGFTNVVVSVVDGKADVVLDMGEVTEAKRAQIEDIVKRKTDVAAENIVITPIATNE